SLIATPAVFKRSTSHTWRMAVLSAGIRPLPWQSQRRTGAEVRWTGNMRPGQTRRPYGHNNNNNSYRNRQQIPNRSQTLDSNGPNVKIRGTPSQIFERYVALAREASTSGDRVAAENLYQHAEHYF